MSSAVLPGQLLLSWLISRERSWRAFFLQPCPRDSRELCLLLTDYATCLVGNLNARLWGDFNSAIPDREGRYLS